MKRTEALSTFGERQQVLLRLLLKNRGGLLIEELATQLEVTRTAVKQHLEALEADAYLARGPLRETSGRPGRLYLLTSKGIDLFPKQYSWFSSIFLSKIRSEVGESGLREKLRSMATDVFQASASRVRGKPAPERIRESKELLLELGYEAELKRGAAGGLPVIEAHNCVFHHIAVEHPEVCEFDLALLAHLTDSEVVHEQCMARGGDCCRFRFNLKNP